MTKKICISGYYGFDNFGDETILKILTEHIKNYKCDTEITVFSASPEKTAENLKVKCINSFSVFKVVKAIMSCDTLISGGGSLLQDSTSAKSLIYYLLILFLAVLFGKKIVIFAQGIGPIKNKTLSFITMTLLKKADYITLRDENSLNLLKKNGINAKICADPVWNLNLKVCEKSNKTGIQLRNCSMVDNEFLIKLAQNINTYYKDKEILILSLQNKLDTEICKRFQEELYKMNPNINATVVKNTSNDKVIKDICSLDELIAMRYHACLIAIKAGVKVLPINYDIKVETIAKQFNLKYVNGKADIDKTFKEFNECEYIPPKNTEEYDFDELELKLFS